MPAEKKTSSNAAWPEEVASGLGKFSWLIALGSAIANLVQGLLYSGVFALPWPFNLVFMNIGLAVWYYISAAVTLVLVFIYVLKPFSQKCAAKDWDALIEDKIGGGFPKMWLMGILLAVFSYGWGCIGVLIPVILLTFIGPGKGRVFGSKK